MVDFLIRLKCRLYLLLYINFFIFWIKKFFKIKRILKIVFLNIFLILFVRFVLFIFYCVLFSFCVVLIKSKYSFFFSVCFILGIEYLRVNILFVFDKCNFLNEFWRKKIFELKRVFRCLFYYWIKIFIYFEVINYKLWI